MTWLKRRGCGSFIFPVGLWVLLNSNMLEVLEATGLSASVSCDVLLIFATLVACNPFFLQAEALLLAVGKFVGGFSVIWVHQSNLWRGWEASW